MVSSKLNKLLLDNLEAKLMWIEEEAVIEQKAKDKEGKSCHEIYTIPHERNVAGYTRKIAKRMHIDEIGLRIFEISSLFHDIGKTKWPDWIFERKGLKHEDIKDLKLAHVKEGVGIIEKVAAELGIEDTSEIKEITNVVKYHHERYDGDTVCKYPAYPGEKKEGHIPLGSRIITVGDHYEAMINKRPYRNKAFTVDEALSNLTIRRYREYDPEIVDIFVEIILEEQAGKKQKIN